jgi:DNA-binding transcriptional ArsR family regulator
MKPLSHVTDPRMVKALAHPLRVQILDALESRTASPSEIADRLDAPIGNVSYHVRKLEALGVLKLVKETPRRGAVEHYYRVETRPSVQGEAWAGTPDVVKEAFLSAMLGNIARQVNAAATGGGFGNDSHVSRLPLTMDPKGFKQAAAAYQKLVDRLKEIEEGSRKRLAKADHQGEMQTMAVLMLFEATGPPGGDGEAPGPAASRARKKRSRESRTPARD